MVDDILLALDNGDVSALVLLDLSAAFDTIDHQILIRRLQSVFGLSGSVLDWVKSYLNERTQTVVVSDSYSDPSLLEFCVPQGSVLGPVLFVMYTQPLSSVIDSSSVLHVVYADDTQLNDHSSVSEAPQMVKRLED